MTRSDEQVSDELGISNLGYLAFIHKTATASSFHLDTTRNGPKTLQTSCHPFATQETSDGEHIPAILTKHVEYINGTVSPSETNRPF